MQGAGAYGPAFDRQHDRAAFPVKCSKAKCLRPTMAPLVARPPPAGHGVFGVSVCMATVTPQTVSPDDYANSVANNVKVVSTVSGTLRCDPCTPGLSYGYGSVQLYHASTA
jgi:hypothetical protein